MNPQQKFLVFFFKYTYNLTNIHSFNNLTTRIPNTCQMHLIVVLGEVEQKRVFLTRLSYCSRGTSNN
jgi:hypothetical protein